MDKDDLESLDRARVTAAWSYLGALVPIVGWILGAISLSNLSSIERPKTAKYARRIQSVRRLAWGGIALSILIACLYGFVVYQRGNENESVQNKVQAAELDTCRQKIVQTTNKIYALYDQYPGSDPLAGLKNGVNPDTCNSGSSAALAGAETSYENAVRAANTRCLNAANDKYNNYLKNNATSTSTGSDGQVLYRMPQTYWDYINKINQQDKDSCNQTFPII